MAETATKAIQFPDGDHVQLARFGKAHHGVKLWPGILGSGNANSHELACDLPAALSGKFAQFGQLHLRVLPLIPRRNPCIDSGVHNFLRYTYTPVASWKARKNVSTIIYLLKQNWSLVYC